MSYHCLDCKQKGSLFADILRARKIKLERQKKSIDRFIRNKIKVVPKLNPEGKFLLGNSNVELFQHYSDSEFSINENDSKIYISTKPVPRKLAILNKQQIQQEYTEEEFLQEKAKRFIQRLRKQKEYNEGKILMMRKREEEKRDFEVQRRDLQRKSMQFSNKKEKFNKLMGSILTHEERIISRTKNFDKSKNRYPRSKTENTEREELSKSSKIETSDKSMLLSLKKKVKQLSEMIGTFDQ